MAPAPRNRGQARYEPYERSSHTASSAGRDEMVDAGTHLLLPDANAPVASGSGSGDHAAAVGLADRTAQVQVTENAEDTSTQQNDLVAERPTGLVAAQDDDSAAYYDDGMDSDDVYDAHPSSDHRGPRHVQHAHHAHHVAHGHHGWDFDEDDLPDGLAMFHGHVDPWDAEFDGFDEQEEQWLDLNDVQHLHEFLNHVQAHEHGQAVP